jgi:hypothetical protein
MLKMHDIMTYGYEDVRYLLIGVHQHCGVLSPKLSTLIRMRVFFKKIC